MAVNNILKIIVIICFSLSLFLFFQSLFFDKKRFYKTKIMLIIYEIIICIAIFFVYKWSNLFFNNITILLSLILNTISIIIFNIKYNNMKKELNKTISILSIVLVIISAIIIVKHSITLYKRSSVIRESDIKTILSLNEYNKVEANDLLSNLYIALKPNNVNSKCLKLYGIEKDTNKENEYFINVYETCSSMYLPPNKMKLMINSKNKTKIEKIYWQFNDNTEITFYENNKQVDDYEYLFINALNSQKIQEDIRTSFEEDLKTKLLTPNEASFTYNEMSYSPSDKTFYYLGYVESKTIKNKNNKESFNISIIKCQENCTIDNANYSWYLTGPNYDADETILK